MRSSSPRNFQVFFWILVALGLVALALGGYLTPVSRIVINPIVAAQSWLASRFLAIQNYFNQPQDLTILREKNAELEQKVSSLQSEIIGLQQQLAETHILSALVDFARVHPDNRYVAAAIIGRDPSPFLKYAIINKGSDNGLHRGMPVVTNQGLVGRIAAVTAGAARVQLIIDPASSVNVRIEPSRAQSVLVGSVTNELSLDMISQSASIQPGDLVLTSGLGGNYPADILMGQVVSVRRRETDLFQQATMQPMIDFNALEIVLVIVNFRPEDISPLIPTPGTP